MGSFIARSGRSERMSFPQNVSPRNSRPKTRIREHKRLIKRSWEWNITVDNQSAFSAATKKAFFLLDVFGWKE